MRRVDEQVGKSVAVYYLPGQDEPRLIYGEAVKCSSLLSSGELAQGFVFAPFQESEEHPLLLIEPEKVLCVKDEIESFLAKDNLLGLAPNGFAKEVSISQEDFVSAVETCVKTIKESASLSKVVLSRPKMHPWNSASAWNVLQDLHKAMPRAFCFLVCLPGQGTWMGATPERLLEVKNGIAQTNALAGTLPADSDQEWSLKEIDEQQIVSDYIAAQLAQAKIKNYTSQGPETISSGSVKHLKTVFEFNIETPQQLTDIVDCLHPTPAVCGMPKNEALAVIEALERYDRAYYTGYLGPLGLEDETRLFVNLRSMQISQGQACLYIGAGITEGSVPEKEWEETEVKAQTLLRVIP